MGGAAYIPNRADELIYSGGIHGAGNVQQALNAIGAAPDFINAEYARSDIRSTTRTGYETFDSQPGLQALLDAMGNYKTIYLPSNGNFNLNGKDLTTKSMGQSIVGLGGRAGLQNGGIVVNHRFCKVASLYLYGASAFGVKVDINQSLQGGVWTDGFASTGPQQPLRTPSGYPNNQGIYFSQVHLEDLVIHGKTIGISYPRHLGWSWAFRCFIQGCSYGVKIDMTDTPDDWGDMIFESVGVTECTTAAIYVVKTGGLRLNNCKCQSNAIGLHLESTTAVTTSPTQGTYITGSCFENNGPNWATGGTPTRDIYITAQAGVAANLYPRWTQIVGGTAHAVVLDKCSDTTISGMLIPVSLTINSGASRTLIIPDPKNGVNIGGTGTDYMVMGINAGYGPYIKVGARLTLIDSVNPTGKFL